MNKQVTICRLLAKSHVTASGCWEWTGFRYPSGYGQISADGKPWRVHRLMYVLEHGEIPEGMNVLHSCDNPPCMNPAHLRAGTQQENMRESVLKERHGTANGKNYSSAGSAVPWVCVNDHDMRDPANVYKDPQGRRKCRKCRNEAVARSHARRKAKLTANDGEVNENV